MSTYTSQPDETAANDTWLGSSNTVNHGTDTHLYVGEDNTQSPNYWRTLIKFDLSSIPAGSTVLSATLSLWVEGDWSSNARTFRAYRQKRAWTESGATWTKYDGINNWSTAGGFSATDCEATDIGSCSFLASESAGTEKQFSLTPDAVTEWIRGTFENNGVILKADTESNDGYQFYSSSSASSSYRPKLVIEYTEGSVFSLANPIVGLFESWKRRAEICRELVRKGAIPLKRRELLPI